MSRDGCLSPTSIGPDSPLACLTFQWYFNMLPHGTVTKPSWLYIALFCSALRPCALTLLLLHITDSWLACLTFQWNFVTVPSNLKEQRVKLATSVICTLCFATLCRDSSFHSACWPFAPLKKISGAKKLKSYSINLPEISCKFGWIQLQ